MELSKRFLTKSSILSALAVVALLFVLVFVSGETRIEPSTKLLVLRQDPVTINRESFEGVLRHAAEVQGFKAAGFSGGLHLIYYFRPPLSLLSYYGDDLVNVTLWTDYDDHHQYPSDIDELKKIFLPIGFKVIDPSLPSP